MGILERLQRRGRDLEVDDAANPTGWLSRLDATASGVEVNETTALNFLAVYASVSLLADSTAMLPAKILRRDADGAQPASDHPASPLLSIECNPETSAMVGRQAIQAQALLGGVGYAEVERDRGGRPLALWPIHWRRITPRRHATTGELVYDVAPYLDNFGDGGVRQGKLEGGTIPDQDMIRIPGLSLSGLRAVSPVAVAREVIGGGLAADRWLSSFFVNGAWPGGWIRVPKAFKDDGARQKYLESVNQRHQGTAKAFRIGLLEEGAEFVAGTIKAEDAQLLELRVDLRREIARLYRVPPHLIGDLERATFNNIEDQGISFVVYTLLPWIIKWEQECARKLLTEAERRTHFVKLNASALLRGNTPARFEAYSKGIQAGFLSPDEAREWEDMNPIPNGKGKVWLFPLNADQIGGGPSKPQKKSRRAVEAFARLLPDELARARRAAQRSVAKALDGSSVTPLDRLLPAWDRARAEARRTLSGAVRAACHAVALESCESGSVEAVAERSATVLLEALSGETAASLRATAEAAYIAANGDAAVAVRAALAAEVPLGAGEVAELLRRIEECVNLQGGGHGAS